MFKTTRRRAAMLRAAWPVRRQQRSSQVVQHPVQAVESLYLSPAIRAGQSPGRHG